MEPPVDADLSPRTRAALLIGAGAMLLWRVLAVSPSRLWRDWLLIVALYALFLAFGSRSRIRVAVESALMAFLLGIYVQGQWGAFATLLGASP